MNKRLIISGLAILIAIFVYFSISSHWFGGASSTGKTIQSADSQIQCTDSDGKDAWNTKGSVALIDSDGNTDNYIDYCDGSKTIDYYCDGSKLSIGVYSPSDCTCKDGVCVASCSGTECNPSNSLQICNNGKWSNCPNDKVCSLGACITPVSLTSAESGGGGSSGGSSVTITTGAIIPSLTTITLGEITTDVTQDIGNNENLAFSIGGISQTLSVSNIGDSSATLILTNKELTFSSGDEKLIDLNGDGKNDLSIKIKSINTITKKVKILIIPL